MNSIIKKLLDIIDKDNIKTHYDIGSLDKFQIFVVNNENYYFHEITYIVFKSLKNNKYSPKLSLFDLHDKFPFSHMHHLEKIIHTLSFNNTNFVSYEEFHNYLSKSNYDDIVELITLTDIYHYFRNTSNNNTIDSGNYHDYEDNQSSDTNDYEYTDDALSTKTTESDLSSDLSLSKIQNCIDNISQNSENNSIDVRDHNENTYIKNVQNYFRFILNKLTTFFNNLS